MIAQRSGSSLRAVEEEDSRSHSPIPLALNWLKTLVLLIVLIGYLFAGAFIFTALEQKPAYKAADEFKHFLIELAEENDCLDDDDVNDLMGIVSRAIGEGSYHAGYTSTEMFHQNAFGEEHWSIHHSFMFSFTVVTTIGYGKLAPRTALGEYFCVFFAVFGITMMAALLFTVGEIFQYLHSRLFHATKKWIRCQNFKISHPRIKNVVCVINGLIVAYVSLVLLSTVIFSYTQGWSFINSHYFSIISLSTIGFGDLVPEGLHSFQNIPFVAFIQCILCIYVTICMGMISTVLNSVQRKQTRISNSVTRKVEHSAFWKRLQHQFKQEEDITTGTTERRRSSSERWTRIRMSVNYNERTRETLLRIHRRSIQSRMQQKKDSKEGSSTI
ncbi:potassium channel subfamily K member 16-like [Lytechinus pictus]|uniref:potassium channel subfamily K member 16-like n=1 Tax=Lytechinus pictus TaxID=7653 RepID=UPI0030B9D2B0